MTQRSTLWDSSPSAREALGDKCVFMIAHSIFSCSRWLIKTHYVFPQIEARLFEEPQALLFHRLNVSKLPPPPRNSAIKSLNYTHYLQWVSLADVPSVPITPAGCCTSGIRYMLTTEMFPLKINRKNNVKKELLVINWFLYL